MFCKQFWAKASAKYMNHNHMFVPYVFRLCFGVWHTVGDTGGGLHVISGFGADISVKVNKRIV